MKIKTEKIFLGPQVFSKLAARSTDLSMACCMSFFFFF